MMIQGKETGPINITLTALLRVLAANNVDYVLKRGKDNGCPSAHEVVIRPADRCSIDFIYYDLTSQRVATEPDSGFPLISDYFLEMIEDADVKLRVD